MLTFILGKKIEQSQRFTKDGERLPVTIINAGPCLMVDIKTQDKNGYQAVCLGFDLKTNPPAGGKKPLIGIIKKAGTKEVPRFLKEVRVTDLSGLKIGNLIKVGDVFKVGDKVGVSGRSKGKGFAGVVKRHHFAGGPKTHGQSDRLRAPGSIGQTTTPGRVYKGKKMAGRLGGEKVTVKNLEVMEVDSEKNILIIKGLVPGGRNGLLTIRKSNS